MILSSSPGFSTTSETQTRIDSMVATSRGFLVGIEEASVLIYEKPEVKGGQPFVRVDKKIQIRDNIGKEVRAASLLLTPKEEYLFVGLSNSQIYKIPFADKSYEEVDRYDSAIQKFHSKKITGMEVCLRKPFVATCSSDRTIKIWNYSEKTSLEISTAPFEEKAIALTIHPSGLHLLVAFPDKIKLFNIFENEIIHFKEIPQKNSTDIKFSNGGHLFAILNNVTVHVYRFYTGE
jgi:WD40 repeat protein